LTAMMERAWEERWESELMMRVKRWENWRAG
jgi:hypothetical protein